MKRFWIILVAVAMAMVASIPAGAAKPDKPPKPAPARFDVTFELSGTSNGGFSTGQCADGGSITMEAGPGGRLIATGDIATDDDGTEVGTDVPLFEVRLPGLEWYRDYPYYPDAESVRVNGFDPNEYPTPAAGIDLTGCHGAGIQVLVSQADDGTKKIISVEDYPRFLMLTVGDGSVDFRWEADYYLESLVTASKNPHKDSTVSGTAMEGFSYSDSNLAWAGVWDRNNRSEGLVTGTINVSHFSPGVYEPFPGSPVQVEFRMTIEPASE